MKMLLSATLRISAVVCAIALGVVVMAPSPAGAATAGACPRIVLTGHVTYPPVSWADGSTLRGAGILIVQRLAKDAGVPISVVNEGSWDAAQAAVKSGKANAIVGIYLTQARLPFFDYVKPAIAQDPSAIVVRADSRFAYKNWSSLVGKKGAVSKGESYGRAFDAYMREHLTTQDVSGFDGVYRALLEKKADYGLVGYYSAITDAPVGIRIAEKGFVTEGLYLAFGKASPCGAKFSVAFSKDIARLVKDGTVRRLFQAGLTEYKSTKH